MAVGTCKLTGEKGPLVKSHVIPKALTISSVRGRAYTQAGRDYAPVKRRDSWYDCNLVTRAGEDILAAYDHWAIETLRRHRLVWSGFGSDHSLAEDQMSLAGGPLGAGLRVIDGIDTKRLRLFLLSILWRAAASNMPEFREVRMMPAERRRLARMLRDGRAEPFHLFPVALIQLSTRGRFHNHAPIAQRKLRDPIHPERGSIPIFRFYFDGLIAHFHRKDSPKGVAALGPMLVGGGPALVVGTRPYEGSWQEENLHELMTEAETRWPDRLAKINRA